MACWFVFEPPTAEPGSFEAADQSLFVKDGWSWGALLAPPFWLLWRKMWLIFLGWLAFTVLAAAAAHLFGVPDSVSAAISVGAGLWLALEGNALRRWTLSKRGWRFTGLATGFDLTIAESGFFARRDFTQETKPKSTPPSVTFPPIKTRAAHHESVLGVFPEPVLQDLRGSR